MSDTPRETSKILTRITQRIPCGCGKCIDCEFGDGRKTVITTVEEVITEGTQDA